MGGGAYGGGNKGRVTAAGQTVSGPGRVGSSCCRFAPWLCHLGADEEAPPDRCWPGPLHRRRRVDARPRGAKRDGLRGFSLVPHYGEYHPPKSFL